MAYNVHPHVVVVVVAAVVVIVVVAIVWVRYLLFRIRSTSEIDRKSVV